jgi:undecaprenyl diphosphate synthase
MLVPEHIAIIMDGNGRWARQRGLPRTAGHRRGVSRIKEIVKEAKQLGVKALTVFAFSTENWNRPQQEVNILLGYLRKFLDTYKAELMREDIRLRIIGRRSNFDKNILKKMNELEQITKNNKSFTFVVAIDYGGRWDIVDAAKRLVKDVCDDSSLTSRIDEDFFVRYLSLGDIGDPELLIRTSGEQRISNFLLWNLAYSELYFTPVMWPDFDKKQLRKALEAYAYRSRRFGGVGG